MKCDRCGKEYTGYTANIELMWVDDVDEEE
jgi:hypothetical protein